MTGLFIGARRVPAAQIIAESTLRHERFAYRLNGLG
jgi:hypothetical protein